MAQQTSLPLLQCNSLSLIDSSVARLFDKTFSKEFDESRVLMFSQSLDSNTGTEYPEVLARIFLGLPVKVLFAHAGPR